MNMKKKKSFLSGVPGWALALTTAFISLIILFVLAGILGDVIKPGDIGEVLAYITYNIIISIACFFICRQNPKSVWYVPIICNLMGIISALVEPNFWITSLWILICGGWVLSLATAILGSARGISRSKVSAGS